ncbi:hypothetical protein BJ138DRAFT_1102762 [Hygrophoropsis aurantiaca]|uniref:Uncharacterized protein n=1 Tax=Hygrophoropsis aurantiaca TaxID=72124 RepID=A0ACB8A7V5_9AGAM|nr:hypothetical protein BJ138DRAFT_1102762 [Hygrophoropsis aurantiaca]
MPPLVFASATRTIRSQPRKTISPAPSSPIISRTFGNDVLHSDFDRDWGDQLSTSFAQTWSSINIHLCPRFSWWIADRALGLLLSFPARVPFLWEMQICAYKRLARCLIILDPDVIQHEIEKRHNALISLVLSNPKLLRDHINDLSEFMRWLSEHYNWRTPVSRIPDEVLVYIFQLVVDDGYGDTLKSCSHVCRRWSTICRSSPLLWNHALNILGDSEAWVLEVLRRSMLTPLKIHTDIGSLPDSLALQALPKVGFALDHISHIDQLYVCASSEVMRHLVQWPSLRCTSAEILESLTLVQLCDDGDDMDLPDYLLNLSAPRLRTLHLEGFIFRWRQFRYRSLTRLIIRDVPESAKSPPSDILYVLAGLSLLKELHLDHVLFDSPAHLSAHENQVQLLDLRRLTITHCPVTAFTCFLQSIQAPLIKHFVYESETLTTSVFEVDLDAFLFAIALTCQNIYPEVMDLQFDHKTLSGLARSADEGHCLNGGPDSIATEPDYFRITINWLWDGANVPRIVHLFNSICCLEMSLHIRNLTMWLHPDFHPHLAKTWIRGLSQFKSVEKLLFFSVPPRALLNALLINAQNAGTDGSDGAFGGDIILPTLRALQFSTVHNDSCTLAQQIADARQKIHRPLVRWPTLETSSDDDDD